MRQHTRKKWPALVGALVILSLSVGVAWADDSSDKIERDATNEAAQNFSRNQPMRRYDYSQARQNLIAAHDAMALGSNSLTAQWVDGVGRTFECPSVGFPLPFGTQLSNPLKKIKDHDVTLPQEEPYGLYPPADVRGTLANCILPNKQVGIFYSEPDLTTYGFDVVWDEAKKMYVIPQNSAANVQVRRLTPEEVKARNINQ